MGETKLEKLDVAAEHDALAAREREKLEKFRQTRALGQEATLKSLEGRRGRCAEALKLLDSIERARTENRGKLSADLRADVLDQRRSEIQGAAATAADEVHVAIHQEREAARLEAALFEPRRFRRLARFDPKDAARDAQIRGTWVTRLARMEVDGMRDLAEEARARGDVALVGALEEELDTRSSALESGTQAERKAADAIREAIDSLEIPELARAKSALVEVERAERECAERIRILRGGRPGGMADIREGLRARQAQGAG